MPQPANSWIYFMFYVQKYANPLMFIDWFHPFYVMSSWLWCSAGSLCFDSKSSPPSEQATETNLWERLGKAAKLDIDSSSFSWNMLSSLHHTEHSSSCEHSEDEMNKPIEVYYNLSCSRIAWVLNCGRKLDQKSKSLQTNGKIIGFPLAISCSYLILVIRYEGVN